MKLTPGQQRILRDLDRLQGSRIRVDRDRYTWYVLAQQKDACEWAHYKITKTLFDWLVKQGLIERLPAPSWQSARYVLSDAGKVEAFVLRGQSEQATATGHE